MATAAVIGLGTMGPGIAATLARSGRAVRVTDSDKAALTRAQASIAQAWEVLQRLDMPGQGSLDAVSIHTSVAAAVAGADLVVENISERLELKKSLLTELEPLVSDECILASDTSGIPISKLQNGLSKPGRVVGMHWSNPPHIIPMIEVIAGEQTEPAVVDNMVQIVKSLGLLPVVVKKDVPGFVENRILYAIMREAVDLVERGVIAPEDLDTCVSWGIGYKLAVIGPMALLDMAGLDIYEAVGSYLNADLCNRDDVSAWVTERRKAGHLGIKSGSGIFDYSPEQIDALRAERAKRLVKVRRALEER